MMKNFYRKSLCTALMLVMVFTLILSGCTNQTGSKDTADTASPETTSEAAVSTDQSTNAETEPIEFSLFVNMSWFPVDKWGVDEVSQEITKKTGVSFNITKTSDDKQLPLLVASGDLPDFIYSDAIIGRLSDSSLCMPMDELAKKYAVDLSASSTEIGNSTMSDGHFYGLRNVFISQKEWDATPSALPGAGIAGMGYRADIMEKLGNPPLKTFEDFGNVLKMVKQKYPDMIPLIIDSQYKFKYFLMQLGINSWNTDVYEEGGKIYHVLRNPVMKDTLKLINSYYQNGYISAESFTYNYDQFQQVTNSGKAFAFTRSAGIANEVNQAFEKANLPYKAALLSNMLSDKAVYANDAVGWASLFITNKNKNPERAIKFFGFMRSEEGRRLSTWGIPEKHWSLGSDGSPVFTDVYKEAKKQSDFSQKVGADLWIFGTKMEEAMTMNNPNDPELTAYVKNARNICKMIPVLTLVVPTEGDELTIYTKLKDLENTELYKTVLAKSDDEFESSYNKILKQADSIGIGKLEEWMTNKYLKVKGNYK